MKTFIQKSLFLAIACFTALNIGATSPVALDPGTYSLSGAEGTGNSKVFKMKNNIYYGRNGGGLAGGTGVEVKNGSMIALKISTASTIKFNVTNVKNKSITDTWSVKAITDNDFNGIIAQYDAGTKVDTYYTNSNSELCTITVTLGDKQTSNVSSYTNETSTLQPGNYGFYLSGHTADGNFITEVIITAAGPTPPVLSSDATLSGLTYGGTAVQGFTPNQTDYEVELPAGTTTVPTVVATTNEEHAEAVVTAAQSLPGVTRIDVTAEDGTSTKTYKITFTIASAAPKVTSATWNNIAGSATIDNINHTISGKVTNGTSLTIEPVFQGNNLMSQNPTGPQDFSNGAVSYTFTSVSQESVTYSVTITEVPPASTDATLSSLTLSGGANINFSPSTTTYNVEVLASEGVPTVSATATDADHATVDITQATSIPGNAKVVVTAEDGLTQKTYTINFTVKVPQTGLSIHVPELYEASVLAGGYETPLAAANGREYEVYYINRDGNSDLSIATSNVDKMGSISNFKGNVTAEAKDGWCRVSGSSQGGDTGGSARDEFGQSVRKINMQSGSAVELHIQGFDQFSFYGRDNDNNTSKCFEVYINGVKQSTTPDKTYSIRRFDLNTGENLIKITALSTSSSIFLAFSLRVGMNPRTKWVEGNDSTQEVLQTMNMKPIRYYTKYNERTEVEWDNAVATGLNLNVVGNDGLGDTLELAGVAECPVGEYPYHIVAYKDDQAVSSVAGKLFVVSKIEEQTDTVVDCYTGMAISDISFRFYALSADDVTLTWQEGTPAGISTSSSGNIYTISGTPTVDGTYHYSISVADGNTLTGALVVTTLDLTHDPILYLYKDIEKHRNANKRYSDGIYDYLKSKHNVVAMQTASELRPSSQYEPFIMVVISENTDANNEEVLALARGEVAKPMLNMKSFTYTPSRLDWGEPNNGTLTENGKKITVVQENHPVMLALNAKNGTTITVLDEIVGKGLMPAAVDYQGTLCIATALTRSDDYDNDGQAETFLHEVPASKRGGAKYLCMPIADASNKKLSGSGKRLLDACIDYLLDQNKQTIALPELKMTRFVVNGQEAEIDQDNNTIRAVLPEGTNLSALQPTIQVADPTTFVRGYENGKAYDFRDDYYGVDFTVTDYINVRHYTAIITAIQPEGVEQVYAAGEWVTIYDVSGRLVTTTNEDVYRMALPQGLYLVVTGRGTMKIMK